MGPDNETVDNIIEEKIPRGKILEEYHAGRLNYAEYNLLFSLKEDAFFFKILTGIGEYKLRYDSTVPEDAYFTNIPMLLNAFYSLYPRYPLYHFDRLLAYGLKRLTGIKFNLYEGLTLLYSHMKYEEEGKSAFTIDAAPLLETAAGFLSDRVFQERMANIGRLKIYEEYNELFVRMTGISIFG